ncbi:hypothetical protein [Cryptosporangium sp. NPDC051539]|uniref:hypothetical protein n=1 Tax=Cryptosporangium sp. NPDC051539 TaxID=3363962 RepID=UPI0037A8366A
MRRIPAAARRLLVHEVTLGTSFVRWVTRRGPHGARPGETTVAYAAGQTAILFGLLFASVVETVVLALIIPWPIVHAVTLVLDVWGVYFVIALHASCVVRPHVVAGGSLRLRYGALLDVRIPAGSIAAVRAQRKYVGSKFGAPDDDGVACVAVAGETTVLVELSTPVRFVRVLGAPAEASAFRFYADDSSAAVAAITAVMAAADRRVTAEALDATNPEAAARLRDEAALLDGVVHP